LKITVAGRSWITKPQPQVAQWRSQAGKAATICDRPGLTVAFALVEVWEWIQT
jgi:hypothetical protein